MFGSIAQTTKDPDYIFTVDTSIEGYHSDTEFRFYTQNTSTSVKGDIFWEEVGNPSNSGSHAWTASAAPYTTSPLITFPVSGSYRIRVPNTIDWGAPYNATNTVFNDKKKIIEINNWGNHVFGNFVFAFYNCDNLVSLPADTPTFDKSWSMFFGFANCQLLEDPSGSLANWDMSGCTSLESAFRYNIHNVDITKWDTSNVTNMYQFFREGSNFNQPIDTHPVINYGREYDAWNVSKVTDLRYALGAAISVSTTMSFNQDLDNWDVRKCTKMSYLFSRARNFNGNISSWVPHSCSEFIYTFNGAHAFNQDISGWDMSSANSLTGMFYDAEVFNQPIGSWNTGNVTSLHSTFREASSFNQPLNDWDTGNVTTMYQMFNYSPSFDQDISSWDTSKVTTLEQFNYLPSNQPGFDNGGVPLSSSVVTKHGRTYIAWDTSKVTDFYLTFSRRSNLTNTGSFNRDISNWDMSSATRLQSMFQKSRFNRDISTKEVTVGAGTALEKTYRAWDVSNVTNFNSMFYGNRAFNQPIGNWQINTGSAVSMNYMFYNPLNIGISTFNQEISQSLQNISGSYTAWDVSKVSNMTNMFYNAYSFNKDIGNWNTKNVENFQEMFELAISFNQDISKWNTISATNMTQMFYQCPNFTNNGIPLTSSQVTQHGETYNSWDTRNVNTMDLMFGNNYSFNIDISNWDTSNVTTFHQMFYGGAGHMAFNQDISTKEVTVGSRTYNAWNVSKGTNFRYMFYQCNAFNQPIGNWQINTGSDVTLHNIFREADLFNQNLLTKEVTVGSDTYIAWDTSRVTSFEGVFRNTDNFNSPIYNWDTSNATDMSYMFFSNNSFNQDISSSLQTHPGTGANYIAWDTKKVTTFNQMFISALAFNKSIQNWNTISGSNFNQMFKNADAFTQSLATQSVSINGETWDSWDVSNSTSNNVSDHGANLNNMFAIMSKYKGEGLSSWNIKSASFGPNLAVGSNFTNNYNDILISWAAQNPTYTGDFNFGSSKYDGTPGSAASASRSQLETINGWVITDGGPV